MEINCKNGRNRLFVVQWKKDTFMFELSKVFNKYGNTKRLLDTTSSLGTFESSPSLKNWKETDDDQYVLKSNKTSPPSDVFTNLEFRIYEFFNELIVMLN